MRIRALRRFEIEGGGGAEATIGPSAFVVRKRGGKNGRNLEGKRRTSKTCYLSTTITTRGGEAKTER